MEGFPKAGQRRLVRCCERHRLEEQLLLLAYEQIRPVIRQRHRPAAAKRGRRRCEPTGTPTRQTRSA